MKKKSPNSFLRIICSSVLLLAGIDAFAQTPTISSFSPASGPLGTTVIITGINFNTTSASNTVFFGATQATSVTATSGTQLIVAVPKGANYQYISVTNRGTGLTAYSAAPFIVTFFSNGAADFTTDATVNPAGAILTYRMALGDLNADGKPDLVVVDNNEGTHSVSTPNVQGNSNVYVFLNTSSPGGIISYTLNNTLALTINNGPGYYTIGVAQGGCPDGSNNVAGVSIKDMDGDGKPDIAITFKNERIEGIQTNSGTFVSGNGGCFKAYINIATYNTYKLAAFRNTTTPGSPSLTFASPSLVTFEGLTDNSTAQSLTSSLQDMVSNSGFCDYFNGGRGDIYHRWIRNWYTYATAFAGTKPPVYLPFGRNITIADFDGDGKPDVAIARDGSAIGYLTSSTTGTSGVTSTVISVYRNTSTVNTISFANSITFTVGGTVSYDLVAGNLDNKSSARPDLVVANDLGTLTVLQNKSTPGALSFTTATTLTSPSNPRALALGDFDNDGLLDIAVANYGSGLVSLFRNTNVTPGTMSLPATASLMIAVGTNPFGLALGDVDGDGKVDLAVENLGSGPTNGVQVFKNNTVGAALSFTNIKPATNYPTGANPQGIVMGDMNNDGRADIAVTNANTAISFMRNIVPAPVVVTSFTPTSGPIGQQVTITGKNFSLIPGSNVVFFGATSANVQAGGTSTTLIVTVPYGANYQYISVTNLDYNSTGYSAAPFVVTFPSNGITDFATDPTISSTGASYAALGDLNGDGKPDLAVATTSSIIVYRNTSNAQGTLSFTSAYSNNNGDNGFVSISDVDGDGKLDVITIENNGSVNIFRNTTVGNSLSFASPVLFSTPQTANENVRLADFDGDGRPDIMVGGTLSTLYWYRNQSVSGTVSFGVQQSLAISGAGNTDRFVIDDLDTDGKPDLVVSHALGLVYLVLNRSSVGAISFMQLAPALSPSGGSGDSAWGVSIGDFDGDNRPDLAVRAFSAGTVSFFLNGSSTGSISFSSSPSLVVTTGVSTGQNSNDVSIGDFDGDGKIDLAVSNSGDNTMSVLRNRSTGIGSLSFTNRLNYATGTSPRNLVVGDMNSDGKPDIAVVNGGSTVSLFRNVATVLPPVITSFNPASGPISTTVTITGQNFNPTAANNIVFFGATSATVIGATSTTLTVTVPYGANYQYISVTNFANQTVPYLASNLTAYSPLPFVVSYAPTGENLFLPKTTLSAAAAPTYVSIADLNRDGKPDLVVGYNPSSFAIFQNTTAQGATATTFANIGSLTITADTSPEAVIGDFDGDGWLDVAGVGVVGSGNVMSVFRNTTSGSATTTFGAKTDFFIDPVNDNDPVSILASDLDADGRPDLAILDPSNDASNNRGIYIKRNTSVSGTINFATSQEIGITDVNAVIGSIAAGDFNRDGKPDLVITDNSGTDNLIVYNNISTVGSIRACLNFIQQ